jgi:glycerophosphoryl diester phosphodiesterase
LQQVVEKKPLFQKIKDKITRKRKVIEDELSPLLENYFSKLRITIEQKEIVRKNSEIDFLLKVPSAVGKITYYCKAKSKNKCDEKDISAAYMEAQTKKLPLLFLYTNEITKKAEDMLDSGVFENVIVKKVGNEI